MLATFKETGKSLRDLHYGSEIIKRSVPEAFWYWLKYPLIIAIIALLIGIAMVTYFAPQIPKLADKYLPEGEFTVQDGLAETTIQQPLVWEDSDFAFIFNLKGLETDLDNYENGILILEDRLIARGTDGMRVIKWSDFEQDFSISKEQVVESLNQSKTTILGVLLGGVVLVVVLLFGLYVIWEAISFLVSSVLFWVVAKVLKRKLDFTNTFKLVAYAAVPALLVQLLNMLLPNSVLPVLSMAVFVFYVAAWMYRLPKVNK